MKENNQLIHFDALDEYFTIGSPTKMKVATKGCFVTSVKVSTVTTHALIVAVIVKLTCPISKKVKRQIRNGEKKKVYKSDGCSGLKYGKNLK